MHKEVELKPQKIDLPKIDVSKYVGQKVKIESVNYFENIIKQKKTYYALVSTSVLEVLDGADPIEIRATKTLGLHIDSEGSIGWGEDTKTGQFLKFMNVENIAELVGKEVTLKTTDPKNGKQFLTF